jgi:hypothetical protein
LLDHDQEILDSGHKLVGNLLKGLIALLFRAFNERRVRKAPMEHLWVSRKRGTHFADPIADRHDILKGLIT